MAGVYSAVGDHEKAELFWTKTIEKSALKPIKVMNLRGYGTFLFNNEKVPEGRKCFSDAISCDLANNDDNRVLKIDTCLMLCDLEREFGDKAHYDQSLTKTMELLASIKSEKRKNKAYNRMSRKINTFRL